jgi:hypothetical protein
VAMVHVCGNESIRVFVWHDNDKSSVVYRRIWEYGEEILVKWCPVGVSVLCIVIDPACQSYGQPYSGNGACMW